MANFRQKTYSNYIASGALKGATIGATIGGIIGGSNAVIPSNINIGDKKVPNFVKKGFDLYNKGSVTKTRTNDKGKTTSWQETGTLQQLGVFGAITLIGAALGAICGAVKEVDKMISRGSANNRLMNDILSGLNKKGFKEGKDFTRNPQEADNMKTKVCIVATRDGANFRLLVNYFNDIKLKKIADKVTKGLNGPTQVRNNTASNRYNEIQISTISNTTNANTVIELATGFIKEGFPVYLVEVG